MSRILRRHKSVVDDGTESEEEEEEEVEQIGNPFEALKQLSLEDVGTDEGYENELDIRSEKHHPVQQKTLKKRRKKKKKKKKKAIDEVALERENSEVCSENSDVDEDECDFLDDIWSSDAIDLNSHREMKQKFGHRIVQSKSRVSQKFRSRSWITPEENWPSPKNRNELGLWVDEDGHEDIRRMFTVKSSGLFFQNIQNFDDLATLHSQHPFHIPTAILFSDALLMTGNRQSSSHVIEIATWGLHQCGIPRSFTFWEGRCGLRVGDGMEDIISRRILVVLLARYSQVLSARGCYRSAFHVAKSTFSLSFMKGDEDPLGLLAILPGYALAAEEYAFSVALPDSLRKMCPNRKLHLLPGVQCGKALGKFLLNPSDPTSSDDMIRVFVRYPTLVSELLANVKDEVSKSILSTPPFDQSTVDLPVVEKLITVFVRTADPRYKTEEVIAFVKESALQASESLSQGRLSVDPASRIFSVDCLDTYSNVPLSDFVDGYIPFHVETAFRRNPSASRPETQPEDRSQSSLLSFFSSFLPWNAQVYSP